MSIIIHLENPFEGVQKWKENTFTSWIIKVVTLSYNLSIETSILIFVCKHCKCLICVSKKGHKLIRHRCIQNGYYINFETQIFSFEILVKWLRFRCKQLVIWYTTELLTSDIDIKMIYVKRDVCIVHIK